MEKQLPLTGLNTVSVHKATDETFNWREYIFPRLKDFPLRGFFIPILDIKAIADLHHVEGMRAYFCLKNPDDFSSISLVVVPVDKEGRDIIYEENTLVGEEGGSSIYDLTRPCPDFCDQTSPLY
jgi:hypothetical protein